MDFILQDQNPASSQMAIDVGGVMNLRDWNEVTALEATKTFPVRTPSGTNLTLTNDRIPPSPEILALSQEDLTWINDNQPTAQVRAAMFLLDYTTDLEYIAPILSSGKFFAEHGDTIVKLLEKRLKDRALGKEWVEYIAWYLHEHPIAISLVNLLSAKRQSDIAMAYFREYTDVRYLNEKQRESLTVEDKTAVLLDVMSNHSANEGRLDVAIKLFAEGDVIPTADAIAILKAAPTSVHAGRLLTCAGIRSDKTNTHNALAILIARCQAERIGVNESVWYRIATQLEQQYELDLLEPYVKHIVPTRGPVGLNSLNTRTSSEIGAVSSNLGRPIGL